MDGQLKEQFIHGLNASGMLVEIIREHTKTWESKDVTSEQVLAWAKRVEVQKAQFEIINSLNMTKDFDKIKTVSGIETNWDNIMNTYQVAVKHSCSYCSYSHPPRWCPAYGKKCVECGKINHLREFCRSVRSRIGHNLEQEPDQHQEEHHIDTLLINSFNFNSKHSVITENLKTSSNQVSIIVPYKVDTDSDGNIMPLHTYKIF